MITAVSLTIDALWAAPSVTAIVSNKIYVSPAPQGKVPPLIAVALSGEDEAMLLAGSSQYPESSVQIHCLAPKASAALDLGETVKLALRDLLFTQGSIKASFVKEPIDFQDWSDDQSTARRVMSFAIRWR